MTQKDKTLIKLAGHIPYSEYHKLNTFISFADTEECKEKLKAVRNLLYEILIGE